MKTIKALLAGCTHHTYLDLKTALWEKKGIDLAFHREADYGDHGKSIPPDVDLVLLAADAISHPDSFAVKQAAKRSKKELLHVSRHIPKLLAQLTREGFEDLPPGGHPKLGEIAALGSTLETLLLTPTPEVPVKTIPPKSERFSAQEASEYLGVSKTVLQRLAKGKRIQQFVEPHPIRKDLKAFSYLQSEIGELEPVIDSWVKNTGRRAGNKKRAGGGIMIPVGAKVATPPPAPILPAPDQLRNYADRIREIMKSLGIEKLVITTDSPKIIATQRITSTKDVEI